MIQLLTNYRAMIALLFITLLTGATACMIIEQNPVTGNRRALGFTWEQEIQIGKEADAEIVVQYGLYDNPALDAYVNQVANNVLKHSHMRREGTAQQFVDTPFTFRVLNSDIVNAFALPGGFIYVTRGLLSHLNNEAQLAVILGHEIGHVAARHASQRVLNQQAGSLILIGGAVLGEGLFGVSAENILNVGGTAAQLLFLSYSRENERESDRLGVEYAAMHGYDASQAAAFFTSLRRLSDQAGGSLPNHLSSHPDPGDRERSMHELSNIWRERGFPQTIINDETYLTRINGITIGENPREGFVENDVFYHPDLEFLFPIPTSWRTINTPTQVAIFNAEQSAISIFNIAQGAENARSAVEAFTNQEGVTVVNSSRFNINNLPGHRAIARARDSKGTDLRIMVQAIEYGGLVYRFLSYSTDQSFNTFEPAFNFMVTGFNRLTDRSKLDIEPVRIEVITANRTGTFESFLPNPIPMGMSAETIAIKNQLSLTDVITRGQKLKLPVQQ